jgi:hypothetical protein
VASQTSTQQWVYATKLWLEILSTLNAESINSNSLRFALRINNHCTYVRIIYGKFFKSNITRIRNARGCDGKINNSSDFRPITEIESYPNQTIAASFRENYYFYIFFSRIFQKWLIEISCVWHVSLCALLSFSVYREIWRTTFQTRILSYLLFDQGSEDDHDLNKSKHFHTTIGGKSIRHRIAMCAIIWLLYYTLSGHHTDTPFSQNVYTTEEIVPVNENTKTASRKLQNESLMIIIRALCFICSRFNVFKWN